jgi:RNA polymerase sigma-70 factor, ECF subfamily
MLALTRHCYDENGGGKVTMDEFEAHRDHLRAVAYRMLGSRSEANDAVQEGWLRFARANTNGIHNARAWLTTVVARVCLDMLRSRKARQEVSLDTPLPADSPDPEEEAMLADSVGLAMMIVLDTLTPAERLAFVLHDTFDVPFHQIAPIVGRSATATKMLASRARRRVRAAAVPSTDRDRQREIVDAFLAASRNGNFAALLDLLDPAVTVQADASAAPSGTPTRLRGASAVAGQALVFAHRAKDAHGGLVNGLPAILVMPHGRLAMVIIFTITNGKIVAIEVIADSQRLGQLTIGL